MMSVHAISRRIARWLVAAPAAVVLIASGPAYGQNGAVAVVHPASGITVDGDLADWPKDATPYPIERVEFGDKPGNADDLKARYRMAFDPAGRALYVAVEVHDDSTVMEPPGEPRWDAQDGCELFIDAAHAGGGSAVFQYARYGDQTRVIGPEEAPEKTMKVAVTRKGADTVYEWRIATGVPLDPDRVIGFDISVADKDKDGSFSWIAWGPGTQKISLPDRCGEAMLVRADVKFGEVVGRVSWKSPSASAVPSRVRIQSTQTPSLWRGAAVDSSGHYKATLIPPGAYSVQAVDSAEIRIRDGAHVEVKVDPGRTAEAGLLEVSPLPWPGLIGDAGVLLAAGDVHAEEVDRFAKAYMDYFKIPGMSLALIKDSKVVYRRGFGVKDSHTGRPVTEGTVFEAASMTKPVLAYTVMRLVDRGVLDLDTPLHTYLPYEDIAHDDRYKLITARMVLTHRTGFPNWRTGKLDIKFVPGTQVSYSGEGFVYLGKVIEKLTGRKLVEICRDEVFAPLGLSNASLVWNDLVARETATGHDGTRPLPKGKGTEPNMAASLEVDAGTYANFLVSYLKGEGLSEAASKEMLRPQIAIPDSKTASWGLGVAIEETPAGKRYGHGGRNTGFTSNSAMWKDKGIGYVVLVNNDDARKMENVLNAYLVFGKSALKNAQPVAHKRAEVDPKVFDAYTGRYRLMNETVIAIDREGDRLIARPEGEGNFEIFPESETVFFIKPSEDATITFVKDASGKVTHAVLRREGRETKATRLEGDQKK